MSLHKSEKYFLNQFLLPLLLLIIINEKVLSQTKNDISGFVRETGSGEVLIGANILLYKDSLRTGESLRGTATTRYGFYSVPNIPAGEYYIFASSIGYTTEIKKVSINDDSKSVIVNFELQKAAIPLDEVVVTDRRRTAFSNTPGTIEVDPALVQTLPSLGGETDIFRALQLLPGVSSATEISTGIYVRGGSADQNLTLIDGVVVYNPSHLGGFSSIFNSDAVKSLKLIKGSFPAEYGGRLSSVLDITMREGSKEKFTGTAGVNTISSRITLEGPLDSNVTYILSGRVLYLNKILPLVKQFDNIPRYGFFDMNGKINYRISEKDRIFISGFFSGDNITNPPVNEDVGFDIKWSNSTLNLTWTSISSPVLFNNTSLMYTNYNFTTLIKDKLPSVNPLDFYTSSVVNDLLIRKELQYFHNENHSFKAGAEAVLHLFNTTTSDYYVKELDYRPNYGDELNTLEASVYVQDDFKITDNFKTNIGGRLYYFQNGKLLSFEPRFSASYFLSDRLLLRGAFAIAHQTLHLLSRNDVYFPTDVWYPSTPDIHPSRSIQASVGFEAVSMDQSMLFSAEGYYKDLSNLYEYRETADFKIGSSFEENITSGRGEAYGIELFLNKRLGRLTGWIGYTLAWTKRYFNDLNNGLPFYPRYDRRHDISVVASVDLSDNLTISGTWTYGTGQAYFLPLGQYSLSALTMPETAAKNVLSYDYSSRDAFRLPPFHKLDLGLRYKTIFNGNEIELSFNIYNAYNRYNAFTKYIGYKLDENGNKIPLLKQFTLFPFLPTFGVIYKF